MTSDNSPSKIWGIWIRDSKTFYWLETGGVKLQFADKLKSILISKNILRFKTDGQLVRGEEMYLDMNLEQAIEKGYETVRLFLNPHIQSVAEEKEKNLTALSKNPW